MRKRHLQSRRAGFVWATVGLLLAATAAAAAQEGQPPPESKSAGSKSDSPGGEAAQPPGEKPLYGEILPRTYYLRDKNGDLQAVLNFPYERFRELYELQNQLDQASKPPNFSISEMKISGAVVDQRAELVAEVSVVVHEDGWVRVPLQLAGAVLSEPAVFDGPGEHFIDRPGDADGYVCWIRSEAGKTHRITLRPWASLSQIGSESHLRLSVPSSLVSSFKLQVPLAKAVARVSEGSTLESAKAIAGNKTQLSVVGLAGDFDLAWHAADGQIARVPTVLEAAGTILVRIDGRRVSSEAKLTVRSAGGEFDRFRVRLPPGAEYVPSPQLEVSAVSGAGENTAGKIYEVKLPRMTTGPLDVRIVADRAYAVRRESDLLELAGFEVVGAVRQWGTVAVQIEGNWQVQWNEMRHVRQVEELAGLLGSDEPSAGFEYSAQPFSLTARVRPQETRVRVEGDYIIQVASDEAHLQARLKCTIRGAKVRALEVDMPGWDIDQIGPNNLVNVDAVAAGQNNPLVVPFLQSISGELELTFEARQKIAADTEKLSLRVPVPRGNSVAPANVTIVPADNVELSLAADESLDLVTQAVRPKNVQLPERQQEPIYLRSTGETPTFAAAMHVHQQEISAAVAAQLEIDQRETRADVRIAYQIAHEPTEHLTLGLPRAIRPEQLAIMLDNQRLTAVVAREPAGEGTSATVPARVALPAPRIGRCELQIKYTVAHDRLARQANTLVAVPLVIPGEGDISANELIVSPKGGVSVTYPKGPWSKEDRGSANNASGLVLVAQKAIPEVALAVSYKPRPTEQSTTIEQAWIQSRLGESQRQDRAVYRFTTTEPSLRLSLPAGAVLASLELEIDGRRVRPELDVQGESRELLVPVSSGPATRRLLEMRYHFGQRPPRGALSLEAPQIRSAGWVRHLYWQLQLPAGEHVLAAPANFAREYRWVWSDFFWRRQPSLGERELESWIGASAPAESARLTGESDEQFARRKQIQQSATNRYLFSTVGAAEPLEVFTLSRARLVLFASLPILICGLVLIYLPAARHPAALLVAALAVVAASAIDPELTLLLAQGASLGVALAALAYLLSRVWARPPQKIVPVHGSSHIHQRQYTEAYARPVGNSSQPSTQTNPLVPAPVPESQP